MTEVDPTFGPRALGLTSSSPEGALLAAIFARAVLDLTSASLPTSSVEESEQARYEALRFLTDATGAWARRRHELASALDLDGDAIRENVIRILEGAPLPDASGLDRARALWEREKAHHAAYRVQHRKRVSKQRELKLAERLRYDDARIKRQRRREAALAERATRSQMWGSLDRTRLTQDEVVDDIFAYIDI